MTANSSDMICTRCNFPIDLLAASSILADDETAWHGLCSGCQQEEVNRRVLDFQAACREQLSKLPRPPEDPLLRKLLSDYVDVCKKHGTYSEAAKASHASCAEQHPQFENALNGVMMLAVGLQRDILAQVEFQQSMEANSQPWHCTNCDTDQPHEILANDENGYKTRCLTCDRETWR